MININSFIQTSLQDAQAALEQLFNNPEYFNKITFIAQKVAKTILNGNKIITCGNGGSMCDAMHFAQELTGRFMEDRKSLPAIAIADSAHITCTGNDYGFDQIFSRYVEGVGQPGDMLIGISTSGNSSNIIEAVKKAQENKIFTAALLGKDGGKLAPLAEQALIVPGKTTDRIQELHIKIIHIIIALSEKIIFSH